MSDHVLTPGDIVKLKEPYRPADFPQDRNSEWSGFEYGIVAEIVSTQIVVNGNAYRNQQPRNVSLNLYDATGQMMIEPTYIEAGLLIPSYVDFHVSELVLYKIATESGYVPVSDPPDWEKVWAQEKAVLSEFSDLE
jgi:hypothetical protein